MTDLELEELAKLESEATPGPWHREMLQLGPGGPLTLGIGSETRAVCIVHGIVESPVGLRDVAFVTALRNASKQLIADAKRLREQLAAAEEVVAAARDAKYSIKTDNDVRKAAAVMAAVMSYGERYLGWSPAGKEGET